MSRKRQRKSFAIDIRFRFAVAAVQLVGIDDQEAVVKGAKVELPTPPLFGTPA